MMGIAWWLLENWLLVLYGLAVLVAYIVGGWRLALGIATLGGGLLLYRQGHKDAERQHVERADRVEKERQHAYDEIDRRSTDRNDVSDRLRQNDY